MQKQHSIGILLFEVSLIFPKKIPSWAAAAAADWQKFKVSNVLHFSVFNRPTTHTPARNQHHMSWENKRCKENKCPSLRYTVIVYPTNLPTYEFGDFSLTSPHGRSTVDSGHCLGPGRAYQYLVISKTFDLLCGLHCDLWNMLLSDTP